MHPESLEQRLSQITTLWGVIHQARDGATREVQSAQEQLLHRYRRAVRRYLQGALRDPHAADELAQEFALRFLRGDLHKADPGRGRFRDYVKGVLSHLVADYYRRQARGRPVPLDGVGPEAVACPPEDTDRQFLESWRDELMSRTWEELARIQQTTGQLFYSVLRCRAAHQDLRSAELAERVAAELGRPVTAAGVRQTLHRAREKFADLLIDEVAHTLGNPTREELEEELSDLGLLPYCRPVLERRSQ